MPADPHTDQPAPDGHTQPGLAPAGPIAMIAAVAQRIAAESGLACTADIQHLALIGYLGLLDSPPPDQPADQPTAEQLLDRCRRNLIIWAWEQGDHDQPLPVATPEAGVPGSASRG